MNSSDTFNVGQPTMDALMNLLAVSDLHLNPESEERIALFLEFLEHARTVGDEILVVGDLFDLWFGSDSLTFSFQHRILVRMKELAGRGLSMAYVEGNRDFFIDHYAGSIFRTVSSAGYERSWGSYRVYAEHGDWINLDDKQYRMFRRFTNNGVSRWIMKHLPSGFLLKQAERLEKKMKDTNLKYKVHYPESHCRRFVEKKGSEGSDLIIVGHFHEEKEWEFRIRERTVLFYNLPGWEKGFRYLVIPDNGQRPYFREQGRKSHGDTSAP